MIIYLVIINLLAMMGILAIIYIIDEVKADRKIKKEKARKEQMKKDLLEIIDEIWRKKNEIYQINIRSIQTQCKCII